MATLHMQLDFPCRRALQNPLTPQYVRDLPPKGPQKHENLCTWAAESPKPETDHILGYVAQNAISSARSPPATTHFCWFPPLKIAPTDA